MTDNDEATLVTKQPIMRRTAGRLALAMLFAVGAPAAVAQAHPLCNAPLSLTRLTNPLARFARKLTSTQPITIVAVGSSSTEGVGASSKAASYPSRLEVELRERFPGHRITVLNRGIGGQVIGDMLKRFDTAVVAAKPDLVLWQLGTNSVLRQRQSATDDGAAISAGLAKIRAIGADVVLINPQYAPKVINKHNFEPMLTLIWVTAKRSNVDLFRRFAVMKRWHDRDHLKFEVFLSRDGLHMNDWSYACMAKGLAAAIAEAATRPVMSATSRAPFEARY